jgi:ParB family chromosome partitioning protein
MASTDSDASNNASVLPITRVGAGVIGATQRSLSEIREERDRLQALVEAGLGFEIDSKLIDPSPFPDRLPEDSDAEFNAFKKLIEEEGQKVPIQVRSNPDAHGRYQIVYGHRRWRACRDLGLAVRAILIELSDRELVVAQGLENSARKDLSWIEKALFAWRMDEAGIKARDIRTSLTIDDPELARLRSVCRALPIEIIQAIGRAPKAGRPRWVELARIVDNEPDLIERLRKTLADDKVLALSSDERFRRAFAAAKQSAPQQTSIVELRSPHGEILCTASFSGANVKLCIEKAHAMAFSDFLKRELPSLTERYFSKESDA